MKHVTNNINRYALHIFIIFILPLFACDIIFFFQHHELRQKRIIPDLCCFQFLFCMLFFPVDAPSKTYTLFPRTSSVPDHTVSTVPYLPDKSANRQNSDNGASTSARGTI